MRQKVLNKATVSHSEWLFRALGLVNAPSCDTGMLLSLHPHQGREQVSSREERSGYSQILSERTGRGTTH